MSGGAALLANRSKRANAAAWLADFPEGKISKLRHGIRMALSQCPPEAAGSTARCGLGASQMAKAATMKLKATMLIT